MIVNGVEIRDSFAEAFPMVATRLVLTADTPHWAMTAARSMTGFATSVIGCGCEAGIERVMPPDETPDGRPGIAVLVFTMSLPDLKKVIPLRVGQCVLTAPTSACYSGMGGGNAVPVGRSLRYFGDGYQIAKTFGGRRVWRVPVMEGEFVCDDVTGSTTGVGGGNFLILARSRPDALMAADAAVAAIANVEGVILPFPGGIVRSGSKVGSKYQALPASTNDAYCPTLRGQVTHTALSSDVGSVLEIVIDGISEDAVNEATRAGVRAVCERGAENGVIAVDAGNYGGDLGPFHFRLRELMA